MICVDQAGHFGDLCSEVVKFPKMDNIDRNGWHAICNEVTDDLGGQCC
jgi:hypothetical protein